MNPGHRVKEQSAGVLSVEQLPFSLRPVLLALGEVADAPPIGDQGVEKRTNGVARNVSPSHDGPQTVDRSRARPKFYALLFCQLTRE